MATVETRTPELRFTNGMGIAQLGILIKHGYEAGQRPVVVAFENVDLPKLICSKTNLQKKGRTVSLCLGGIVLDVIAAHGLPMGALETK